MPTELTDEVAASELQKVFDEVVSLFEALQVSPTPGKLPEFVEVHAGSSIARDDQVTAPYQSSHAILSRITASLEHQHAVYSLIAEAGVLHPNAPFTLYRGAIESAATALWLLGASTRTERAERAFRMHWYDLSEGDKVATTMGAQRNKPLSELLSDLFKVAESVGVSKAKVSQWMKYSQIVETADELSSGPMRASGPWKICSGIAHSMLWPAISFQNKTTFGTGKVGVVHLQTTTDVQRVLWAGRSALDLTHDALRLYQKRSRPYSIK